MGLWGKLSPTCLHYPLTPAHVAAQGELPAPAPPLLSWAPLTCPLLPPLAQSLSPTQVTSSLHEP